MKKRIFGIALAFCLLFSSYPVSALTLEEESKKDRDVALVNVTQLEEKFQEAVSELPDGVIVGDSITRAEWTHDLITVC